MTEYARVDLPTGIRTKSEIVTLQSGVEVQVCRASVQRAHAPSLEVVLLLDAFGRTLASSAGLRQLTHLTSPAGILAGLLSARSGEAVVVTLPECEGAAEDVALTAAVCAASWGWDESESIRVQMNDRSWSVVSSFQDGQWMARIGR